MSELDSLNKLVSTHHVTIKMNSLGCTWLGAIMFLGESDLHHYAASTFPELVKGFIEKIENKYNK